MSSQSSPTFERRPPARSTDAHEIAEDVMGFGVDEVRLTRDLLLRPRRTLHLYLEGGSTAGGLYPRPLRYFLGLNGILMLVLFLMGGYDSLLASQLRDPLAPLAQRAGKSVDAFLADFDSWLSLLGVPSIAVFIAVTTIPALKVWSGMDWRRSFRAAWVYLSAWTIPMLPLSPFLYDARWYSFSMPLLYLWGAVPFLVMGRGVWFSTWRGGLIKALVLVLLVGLGANIGSVAAYIGSLAGAVFGP